MTRGLRIIHSTPGAFPAVIKKYSNRRLYNTETSSYVTLDQLASMARAGTEFIVYDATTGDDITRLILVQIVAEKESSSDGLMSLTFLRQLTMYYEDSLEPLLPGYLEQCMLALARSQDQMRQYLQVSRGAPDQADRLEEMSRRNFSAFERTLQNVDAKEDDSKNSTTEVVDELRDRVGDLENLVQEMLRTGRFSPLDP